MRQSLWLSIALHFMCFLIALVGMPFQFRSKVVPDTFMSLEVVKPSDIDELNKKPQMSKPEPEPKPAAEEESKPPEIREQPQSMPKQNLDGAVPDIKKQPEKKPSNDKTLSNVLDNVVKEENLKKQFDSMLKNVEKTDKKNKKAKVSKDKTIKDVFNGIDTPDDGGEATSLSTTEEDAIRQQIYPNWFVPAGIKNAENIIVEIEVRLGETGEVISAKILDEKRCMSEHSIRVAAESAKRAVILSSPIKVPPSLRGTLRKFVLRFNPKDILTQ